jgi:hypothetical protein
MRRAIQLVIVLALGMVVSACGSLPGLRVLTGQDSPNTQADTIVQSADFVMADKTGLTDPALLAAADRIEAASGTVDIIEIRSVPDERAFIVDMLFNPPQTDTSTQAGQVAQLDSLRRAIELTWQGTMNVSTDADLLQVTLYAPQTVQTLRWHHRGAGGHRTRRRGGLSGGRTLAGTFLRPDRPGHAGLHLAAERGAVRERAEPSHVHAAAVDGHQPAEAAPFVREALLRFP